jgi:hypothetical protein
MAKFYIVKWPIESGLIVCDGNVTAKQAVVDRGHHSITHYNTHFSVHEFTTDLDKAKKIVADKISNRILYLEEQISDMKKSLEKVRALTEDTATLWTSTAKEEDYGVIGDDT